MGIGTSSGTSTGGRGRNDRGRRHSARRQFPSDGAETEAAPHDGPSTRRRAPRRPASSGTVTVRPAARPVTSERVAAALGAGWHKATVARIQQQSHPDVAARSPVRTPSAATRTDQVDTRSGSPRKPLQPSQPAWRPRPRQKPPQRDEDLSTDPVNSRPYSPAPGSPVPAGQHRRPRPKSQVHHDRTAPPASDDASPLRNLWPAGRQPRRDGRRHHRRRRPRSRRTTR